MPRTDQSLTAREYRRGTPGPARIHRRRDDESSGDMSPVSSHPSGDMSSMAGTVTATIETVSERFQVFADVIRNMGIDIGASIASGLQQSLNVPPIEPVQLRRHRMYNYRVTIAPSPSRQGGISEWLQDRYVPPMPETRYVPPPRFHYEIDAPNVPGSVMRIPPDVAEWHPADFREYSLLTDGPPFGNISSSDVADAATNQRIQDMPRRRNRQLCECGCGNMTETGRFLRGHATRRRWQLIKAAELSVDDRMTWSDPANGTRPLSAVRHELGSRGWRMPVARRTFGIEFELVSPVSGEEIEIALVRAGIPVFNYGSYTHRNSATEWTIKTDSSIRSHRTGGRGLEIVSPPLRGKRGEAQVRKVLKVLNDLGCSVNQTCGTHVHVGASDLSVDGIRNVVLGYATHQDAIDKVHAPSRRNGSGNQYCRRHLDRELAVVRAARSVAGMAGGTRYVNVNLNAYPRLGTVEFRQHGGTLNATKILAWVEFVRGMVQAAPKVDLSAIDAGTVRRNGSDLPGLVPVLNAAGVSEDASRYLFNRYLAA